MDRPLIAPGASVREGGGCRFEVWAPRRERVELVLLRPARAIPMTRGDGGLHEAFVAGAGPGTRYFYRVGGADRPDPASRLQPEGVHGPSVVIDPRFDWTAAGWKGLPLEDYVLYELHVGTFTPEGTFDAAIGELDRLRDLGVTAVELMPVAEFPGGRNWGYDGVGLFAAQSTYGGPDGLRRFVDACHARGMAAVLDVVYNHLGPEGNYLAEFGPYFTGAYRTPWGDAINFDGPESDEVRRYFLSNAHMWLFDFRFDALRLDAVHAIVDRTAATFLAELARTVRDRAAREGRRAHLIAETNMNDPRLLVPQEENGGGIDAQWNDDFHHSLHALLTGERSGYFADYGGLDQLAKAWREGFVFTGQHSKYRGRRHGRPSAAIPAGRFVVFSQNHDQVGNRPLGERLTAIASPEACKLAAACTILSPYLPMLFMGEEYGETAPFRFFTSHGDPALVEAVRRGRKEEFKAFEWGADPPDPQDEATFRACKLGADRGGARAEYTRELLRLRREVRGSGKEGLDVRELAGSRALFTRRWTAAGTETAMLFHFGRRQGRVALPLPAGRWERALDSADARWGGPGARAPAVAIESTGDPVSIDAAPESCVVLRRASTG